MVAGIVRIRRRIVAPAGVFRRHIARRRAGRFAVAGGVVGVLGAVLLGLLNHRRRVYHRLAAGGDAAGLGGVAGVLQHLPLHRSMRDVPNVLHRHALVDHHVVHVGNVGDVHRLMHDRHVVDDDVMVHVAFVDVLLVAIDVTIGRHVAIDQPDIRMRPKPALRWQRRPAAILAAFTPGHPCRRPGDAGNPHPAIGRIGIPPAIVVRHASPIRFIALGDPRPAVIAVFPVTDRIRPPLRRPFARLPASAVAGDDHPVAVGAQIIFVNRLNRRRRRHVLGLLILYRLIRRLRRLIHRLLILIGRLLILIDRLLVLIHRLLALIRRRRALNRRLGLRLIRVAVVLVAVASRHIHDAAHLRPKPQPNRRESKGPKQLGATIDRGELG